MKSVTVSHENRDVLFRFNGRLVPKTVTSLSYHLPSDDLVPMPPDPSGPGAGGLPSPFALCGSGVAQ